MSQAGKEVLKELFDDEILNEKDLIQHYDPEGVQRAFLHESQAKMSCAVPEFGGWTHSTSRENLARHDLPLLLAEYSRYTWFGCTFCFPIEASSVDTPGYEDAKKSVRPM